jgi:predicted dienelactone hydrolase
MIVSHGYPGNRFLMSHFGENLASKGFVVASHRPHRQHLRRPGRVRQHAAQPPDRSAFVIDEMARLAADDTSFMAGLVDADRSAIIGYSMGGFGALNAVGAGFTEASATFGFAPPRTRRCGRARPARRRTSQPRRARIRAVIAIAPWGMPAGFWDAEGLAGITTPVMFMAGSVDDVAGYERGARPLFEGTATPSATCSPSSTPTTTRPDRSRRRVEVLAVPTASATTPTRCGTTSG